MAEIKVPTSFNIDLEFEIPEFYRRLFSLLIDVLIEFFYLRIAIEILKAIDHATASYNSDSGHNLWAFSLLLFLPVMIYHLVLEITMNGQSFGKKMMGLKVVNENGGRPGFSQFIIRWLLRVSDVWIVLLIFVILSDPGFGRNPETTFIILAAVGFLLTDIILVITTPKSQRLGDILAKTILIRTHSRGSITDSVFVAVADDYNPVFPQIMQLNDKDINAIKNILEAAKKKGNPGLAHAASEKIRKYLAIETVLPPVAFLEVLMKDYNYLSSK